MRLAHLHIRNFRCLRDVEIPLDDVTVLIGENNAGKSAVLDALRLALRGGPNQRAPSVREYDFHLADRTSDPREVGEIQVELVFEETQPEQWPDRVVQDLNELIQLDVARDRQFIRLGLKCSFEEGAAEPKATWRFLNQDGDEIRVKNGPQEGLRRLLRYVHLHALAALRDAGEHFSQRSGIWAPFLRSLAISEADRAYLEASLEELNRRLLASDPRLAQVTQTLEGMGNVVTGVGGHEVMVQALPMKPWELMSRAQVAVRAGQDRPELPLDRHGQGIQTLAVLFLFRAYIEHLMASQTDEGAEPLLTVEEPEAHLHPQSARALWSEIRSMPGQVVVTSHSPYFVQLVPFRKLRLLRRTAEGTKVFWLRDSCSVQASPNEIKLQQCCQNHPETYSYEPTSGRLTVSARIGDEDFRRLLKASPNDAQALRNLQSQAACLISDEELIPLESAVRRIRGEILFARAWILCEGETDLVLLQTMADLLGQPLDRHGISLVDRSGGPSSLGALASLARAFGFPWFALCDGDGAGCSYIKELRKQGFGEADISARTLQLPEGQDIERFMVVNGFRDDLVEVATDLTGTAFSQAGLDFEARLDSVLDNHKPKWARALSRRLLGQKAGPERVPTILRQFLERVIEESVR